MRHSQAIVLAVLASLTFAPLVAMAIAKAPIYHANIIQQHHEVSIIGPGGQGNIH